MLNEAILLPVIAMFFLSFTVSLLLIKARYRSVKEREVRPDYFKLNRGAKLPEYLTKATQHYENLYETPVLFYVICILIFITHRVDWIFIVLAWSYVFSRVLHAYIHMGSNNLIQRKNIFVVNMIVLLIMWTVFTVQVIMGMFI